MKPTMNERHLWQSVNAKYRWYQIFHWNSSNKINSTASDRFISLHQSLKWGDWDETKYSETISCLYLSLTYTVCHVTRNTEMYLIHFRKETKTFIFKNDYIYLFFYHIKKIDTLSIYYFVSISIYSWLKNRG